MATTFAADTPLAIAGLVATGGVAANWFWWADVLPVMIGALLVSHLWRRSAVLTDNEIVELRYGGPTAAGLWQEPGIELDERANGPLPGEPPYRDGKRRA